MINDFKGKVAVITGGASGIGLGLANAFSKRGMKLVLADIDKKALDKVSKEFSDKNVEVILEHIGTIMNLMPFRWN